MFHKTTPDLQYQDQDQDRTVQDRDQDQDHSVQDKKQKPIFWSQTGLVLRPTVSDHISVVYYKVYMPVAMRVWIRRLQKH